jgi:hypothetical protein
MSENKENDLSPSMVALTIVLTVLFIALLMGIKFLLELSP